MVAKLERISVVIPTLNEAGYLPRTVEAVRRYADPVAPPEIIVADCGSTDGTPDLARRLGTRLATCDPPPRTRAAALNAGAREATGDAFLFLHADSVPPPHYDRLLLAALRRPGLVGGAFEFAFDGGPRSLRVIELINRLRYALFPSYYGDQGIFARAESFRAAGGFPERGILEDSGFCRALRRTGRLVVIRVPMRTSPRRFVQGGIARVFFHDVWIWSRDLAGFSTERFSEAYRRDNLERGGAVAALADPASLTPRRPGRSGRGSPASPRSARG